MGTGLGVGRGRPAPPLGWVYPVTGHCYACRVRPEPSPETGQAAPAAPGGLSSEGLVQGLWGRGKGLLGSPPYCQQRLGGTRAPFPHSPTGTLSPSFCQEMLGRGMPTASQGSTTSASATTRTSLGSGFTTGEAVGEMAAGALGAAFPAGLQPGPQETPRGEASRNLGTGRGQVEPPPPRISSRRPWDSGGLRNGVLPPLPCSPPRAKPHPAPSGTRACGRCPPSSAPSRCSGPCARGAPD